MKHGSVEKINFDKVALSQLVAPAKSLPARHTPSARIDSVGAWVRARAVEEEVLFSSRIHDSPPSLIGYIMAEIGRGRSELVTETISGVPFATVRKLKDFVKDEGGEADKDPTFPIGFSMAIGKYLLEYQPDSTSHRWQDDSFHEGSLAVTALDTAEAASAHIAKLQQSQSSTLVGRNTWGY